MVEFTLFGVPVRIFPTHWLGLALIGGILQTSQVEQLMDVLFFVFAGFISILAHEMGHALVGRKLGNTQAAVSLIILGGYTEYNRPHFTKWGNFFSILSGPLASAMVGVVAYIVRLLILPSIPINQEALGQVHYLLSLFIIIAIFWTILNMLPIYPLDGGKLLEHFVKSPKKLHLFSAITALAVMGLSLLIFKDSLFLAVLMGYLAFLNFQTFRNAPF